MNGKSSEIEPKSGIGYGDLVSGIGELLEIARRTTARSVNAIIIAPYEDHSQTKRATLSRKFPISSVADAKKSATALRISSTIDVARMVEAFSLPRCLGEAQQVFGAELSTLIDELNGVLVA